MTTLSSTSPDRSREPHAKRPLFSTLLPELFSLIADHLPRTYRPATLLALALTCRRFCKIVIPCILYRDVRIRGDIIFPLRIEAKQTNRQDLNIPWSHYIHSLYIEDFFFKFVPLLEHHSIGHHDIKHRYDILSELYPLIQCGGLRNLESLTMYIRGDEHEWKHSEYSFWSTVEAQCVQLKEVRLIGISEDNGIWLYDSGVFQLQVRNPMCFI